jgi:hypothetical protein
MKTAVEWLIEKLKGRSVDLEMPWNIDLVEQAKEMEKQQHEQTFNESRLTHPMIGFKHETFKDYWNETNP